MDDSLQKTLFVRYRENAEEGHAKVQYHLGLCYDQAKGVEQDLVTFSVARPARRPPR